MAKSPRFGFYYAIAGIPLMGAGIFGPDVLGFSFEAKKIAFLACVALTAFCVLVGAIKELQAEAGERRHSGHIRRMIALYGMSISGILFLVFVGFYCWPVKTVGEGASQPTAAAAKSESPAVGSIRFVTAIMKIDFDQQNKKTAGTIEIELFNDTDRLIKFHVVTAGNINGVAFSNEKFEFDGVSYPRQNFFLVSNRIYNIPIGNYDIQNPSLDGLYEYNLSYKFSDEIAYSRKSSKSVKVLYWLPISEKPAGTVLTIPSRVILNDEIEE